jgi:hypothetical protein
VSANDHDREFTNSKTNPDAVEGGPPCPKAKAKEIN